MKRWAEAITQRIAGGARVLVVLAGVLGVLGPDHGWAGGTLYWTDDTTGKIQRASVDGSMVEDLVTGAQDVSGLALDAAGNRLYWSDGAISRRILRADLDGNGVEVVVAGAMDALGLALDVDEATVYFTIPLDLLHDAVDLEEADTLDTRVLVRRRGGSGDSRVRFWYGGSEPPPPSRKGGSHFEATVDGTASAFYLRGAACAAAPCDRPLVAEPGPGAVASVQGHDVERRDSGDQRRAPVSRVWTTGEDLLEHPLRQGEIEHRAPIPPPSVDPLLRQTATTRSWLGRAAR
jgi:hypothetical protein